MINEPFANGNSWLHKVDPRYKIVLAVLYCIQIAVSSKFTTLGVSLFFSLILVFLAEIKISYLIKHLYPALFFMLFMWIVLPFTFSGDAIFKMGPFELTKQGTEAACIIALKSTAILTGITALISTMTVAVLGHTLSNLKVSDKLVYLLLITYRYIFVIQKEYSRLLIAAKTRGFQASTSIHTYKTYACFVGMLFVRSFNRASRVLNAMKCRGFNGKFYSLSEFKDAPKLGFCILMISALTAFLFIEIIS